MQRKRLLGLLGVLLLLAGGIYWWFSAPETGDWEESFAAADDWLLSSDAAAQVVIEDGQLQLHIWQPGQVAWAAAEHNFADFDLRVEATQVAGPENNEYGVLVRMDADAHFYAFSISGDGYARVSRYEEGRWELLGPDWVPQSAIHAGAATNVLEVKARGADFTFLVNGAAVAQVADETFSTGGIGLYAGAFEQPDVEVAFDNLQVFPAP
ncbi:MAG: hypothetical protein U9Q70_10000 [Chloroflexota bacterium]|nr:hypothetical protein [Chloroflexota bacterium]